MQPTRPLGLYDAFQSALSNPTMTRQTGMQPQTATRPIQPVTLPRPFIILPVPPILCNQQVPPPNFLQSPPTQLPPLNPVLVARAEAPSRRPITQQVYRPTATQDERSNTNQIPAAGRQEISFFSIETSSDRSNLPQSEQSTPSTITESPYNTTYLPHNNAINEKLEGILFKGIQKTHRKHKKGSRPNYVSNTPPIHEAPTDTSYASALTAINND